MAAHTIEVEVDRTGRVRAVEPNVTVPAGRALLTPLVRSASRRVAAPPNAPDNWRSLIGALQGSPNWSDDPQAIQQALRDEWR